MAAANQGGGREGNARRSGRNNNPSGRNQYSGMMGPRAAILSQRPRPSAARLPQAYSYGRAVTRSATRSKTSPISSASGGKA